MTDSSASSSSTLQRIIHIAQIGLDSTTGMGRTACEWKMAAEKNGLDFHHIGPQEVGPVAHRLVFPLKARKIAEKLAAHGTLFLIHEPCAWAFQDVPHPKVAFSHGIELRGSEIEGTFQKKSPKSKLTQPLLHLLGRRGLVAMNEILVSNQDDKDYLVTERIKDADHIRVFRNGIDPFPAFDRDDSKSAIENTIVFNGSWIARKGIDLLVRAAALLAERGIRPHWLLIGTSKSREEILSSWPPDFHSNLTIVPTYQRHEEASLLSQGEIFVLPTFFEGQSLALLQAMAAGLCCITSDCCGQKDVIHHGQNGLLFTPGDDLKLADLIQQVWENRDLRHELGRNASASVVERTWSNVANDLILWLKETGEKHMLAKAKG